MTMNFDELLVANEREGYFHRGRIKSLEKRGRVLYAHLLDHEEKLGKGEWRKSDLLLCSTVLRGYAIKEFDDRAELYCRETDEKITLFRPVIGVGALLATR